jgi:hypothetical protein
MAASIAGAAQQSPHRGGGPAFAHRGRFLQARFQGGELPHQLLHLGDDTELLGERGIVWPLAMFRHLTIWDESLFMTLSSASVLHD